MGMDEVIKIHKIHLENKMYLNIKLINFNKIKIENIIIGNK